MTSSFGTAQEWSPSAATNPSNDVGNTWIGRPVSVDVARVEQVGDHARPPDT